MPVAPHIAELRAKVGHDLLLLPSVAVLVLDDAGRVLLGRHADEDRWGTIGGAVDVDESPADAARREALEEIGVPVELTGIVAVLGGPDFRKTYPNGDRCAYVTTAFSARVSDGVPAADEDELSAIRWFTRAELDDPELSDFARATFTALGWL